MARKFKQETAKREFMMYREEKRRRAKTEIYPYENPTDVRDPIWRGKEGNSVLFHQWSFYDLEFHNKTFDYMLFDNATPYGIKAAIPDNATDFHDIYCKECQTTVGSGYQYKHDYGIYGYKVRDDLIDIDWTYETPDVVQYFEGWQRTGEIPEVKDEEEKAIADKAKDEDILKRRKKRRTPQGRRGSISKRVLKIKQKNQAKAQFRKKIIRTAPSSS